MFWGTPRHGITLLFDIPISIFVSRFSSQTEGREAAIETCKTLCKRYNTLAMQLLEQGDLDVSLELLQKAEVSKKTCTTLSRTRKPK